MGEEGKFKSNFRGKKMNLLEARLYLQEILDDKVKINLNETEKENYYAIKDVMEKYGHKEFSEKDYTIFLLEVFIDLKERFDRIKSFHTYGLGKLEMN
jgi:hypothetical protein